MDDPKVLPLLIPQLVNPQLQYEDFEIVHTVLQEMFDVVDKWVYFIIFIVYYPKYRRLRQPIFLPIG